MFRSILIASALLSTCSANSATVGSQIQERFVHFHGTILVDGVDSGAIVRFGNDDRVHYSAEIEGGVVTDLTLIPTGAESFRGAEEETVAGTLLTMRGNVQADGVTFTTSYGGPDPEATVFVPFPSIFDEPETWGELVDNMDGTFTLADVDGPWFLPDLTIFQETLNGSDVEIIIDRVGWFEADSIVLDSSVPEPGTWVLLAVGLGIMGVWRWR